MHGYAYLVETAEQMRKLARYETSAYTAHVCTIEFQNEHKDSMTIDGMAFVYAADPEALKTENFDRQLWQQQMGIMMPDVWNKRHGDQE